MPEQPGPVLLYDGTCGLCNGVVRLMLRNDPAARLRYAPLQSAPAQEFLRLQGLPTDNFDSMVFVPDWADRRPGAYLLRTDGALAAFALLQGPARRLAWLRVVPSFLRDAGYRLIARTRLAIFGEYRKRPLPDPAWERRFLAR
jgi:predicted DCC family thiol-disulfide oxidoreductase YuxK